MGMIELPDHLKQVIAQKVSQGLAESEAAYLEEAVRRYAEDLEAEDEIVTAAELGIRDIAAGRYVTVSSPDDVEVLHKRAVSRLRDQLEPDRK